jgi:hypothetical protein
VLEKRRLVKMQGRRNSDEWGPESASYRLAALAGTGLIGLGVIGLVRPRTAAEAYGLPLRDPRDFPFVRVKAARDLAAGLAALTLLTMGERRALGAYLVASTLIPALDALLVLLTGTRKPWQVAMHGGTAVLVLPLGAALIRRRS